MNSMMCRLYVGNFLEISLQDKLYTNYYPFSTIDYNTFLLIINR